MYLTFLKWVLFCCLMGVGATCIGQLGVYDDILAQGWVSTSICVTILGLFLAGTFSCGLDSMAIGHFHKHNKPKSVTAYINYSSRKSVFISTILPSLGLLGTILGMIAMNKTIPNMDLKNADLGEFAGAMGTALYTTAVGIGLQTLLRIQCFVIKQDSHKYGGEING